MSRVPAIAGAACFATCLTGAPARAQIIFETLNFGATGTFLTGIRGDSIVGNFVIPGGTGGLLYSQSAKTWAPFPVATASGANYPGASGSSPYGPGFGSQNGILRAVGSYKTAGSPYDLSYLYDGAGAPGANLTPLGFPGSPMAPTLNTIAHSTFGNQAVGNYDSRLATGNAFIYNIATGGYATNNFPGAVSTTAYGVWGDKIAGGYAQFGPGGGPAFERGYIYDQTRNTWTSYSHPGALFTHFEGITGAGRAGEYNLVADWSGPDGVIKASVLHLGADGAQTWIDYAIPGAPIISANSAYENKVIGIYVDAGGVPNGYVATIPGIYNPIRNAGPLTASAPGGAALLGADGDDVVNDGSIVAAANASAGIRSGAYGVITNNGGIAATGLGAAAIEMHGAFGTLLNQGTITAASGADAIRTGPTALGTAIVNDGTIDGRVSVIAGPGARFENSGWLGVSAPGGGTTHAVSGTFVQTSVGTLVLRAGPAGNDQLVVTGVARLAGAEVSVFQPGGLSKTTAILTATGGYTGQFDSFTAVGLPGFVTASLGYGPNTVSVNLASNIARTPGLSPNEVAVGGAIDTSFNTGVAMQGGAAAVYASAPVQLPGALGQLSGEAYASQQTVLIDQAIYARQAVLGRLQQISYAGRDGAEAALGATGPAVVAALDDAVPASASVTAEPANRLALPGLTFWSQGFGAWGHVDGGSNESALGETFAGVVIGADARTAGDWQVGVAIGYSNAEAQISALSSSLQADTGLIAVYAGNDYGPWAVRAGGAYGFSSINTSRAVALPGFVANPTSDNNAGTGQTFGEVGYAAAFGALALEPFGGLTWVHLNTTSFTESGEAALTGAGATRDVGYTALGVRTATSHTLANGMAVTLRASLAWQHAFGDVTPSASLGFVGASGNSFSVTGAPIARDAALIDVGVDLRISQRARFGISYSGQSASQAHQNAVTGNFTWSF